MKLVHNIDTMTVGRYGLFDQTQNTDLFMRVPLPSKWFTKQINPVLNKIGTMLNSGAKRLFSKEKSKLMAYTRIIQLTNLYNALHTNLVLKIKNDALKNEIGKDMISSKNLEYFIGEVKRLTNIEVKNVTDLKRLEKDIDRRQSRFSEAYKKEEKPDKELTFMQYALSIFNVMEMQYDTNMTLREFDSVKELALERIKKLEDAKRKHK